MRKAMWKKGLSVAMAAAMLTGTVTVPAVFNTSAIVKAAEVAEKSMPATPKAIDGMVYATVNMEYADFFYGELNNIAAGNETTPDLSNDKVASYRETGMYDAVTSATNKKSIKYATSYYETGVANDEAETKGSNGTISNTTLYGIKEVKIAIPEALYHNLYEQKDDSANKNSKIYEYLNNADYSDEEFKSEYKVLNADGTFSKMITTEGTVEDKDAEPVLTTSTTWGDYQVDIANLGVGDTTATTTNMYGIILTDEKGENYGLLHSDNTWLQTQEFAWAVDDVFSVHGQNHVPYQRTDGLKAGNTIKKITYLLKDSADIVINTNIKLKKLIDAEKVKGTADKATYSANGTAVKFNFENLPAEDYKVATVAKGGHHATAIEPKHWTYDANSKTLTLDETCAAGNDYTVTFKSEEFGDLKVAVTVDKADQTIDIAKDAYTDTMGATSFNLGAKANTALKYATSNDKVATVDENGKVTLKGAGTAEITVTAEANDNYNEATKTVKITVNKAPETTTATKPAATTTATKPAVKPVKKVTVKKQTAKVKAGKKKLTVTWKKDKAVSGYQIKVATKKNFKGAKTYTVKSYKTYKKVIKKLKSKKKYYVKVRAYKTVGKSKVYGAYSAVRSCKVK